MQRDDLEGESVSTSTSSLSGMRSDGETSGGGVLVGDPGVPKYEAEFTDGQCTEMCAIDLRAVVID